jgi:hypothetical protein
LNLGEGTSWICGEDASWRKDKGQVGVRTIDKWKIGHNTSLERVNKRQVECRKREKSNEREREDKRKV